jgi:hypothetical protein
VNVVFRGRTGVPGGLRFRTGDADTVRRVNGELACLVALTLHGNAWLSTGRPPAPPLERTNSAFGVVRRVRNVGPERRWPRGPEQWGSLGLWLEDQKAAGATRLRLFVPSGASDPAQDLPASSVNSVPATMACSGRRTTLWTSAWSVGDRSVRDGRPWDVSIRGTSSPDLVVPAPALAPARTRLLDALHAIRGFAADVGLADWASFFGRAVAVAESDAPAVNYAPDIAPAGSLSPERHRLLAAAVQAWAFGGMGSWNDVWVPDETRGGEYPELTRRLFAAVVNSVVSVTNSA